MARKLTVLKKFPEAGFTFYKEGYIKILNAKLSYPHFDKPQKFERDDGTETEKYGCEGLVEVERINMVKPFLVEQIKKIMEDRDCKCSKDKWFIIEGDGELRPEVEGFYQIKASESRKPDFFTVDGDEITIQKDLKDLFYPGCRVDILIRPWGQNYKDKKGVTSKRVNAGLVNVKFRNDDTRLGEEPIDTSGAWDDDEDDEHFEKAAPGGSKGSSKSQQHDEDDDL